MFIEEPTSVLRKANAAYFRDQLKKGENHLGVLECIIQSYQPQSKKENTSTNAWRQHLSGKRHGEGEPSELFRLDDSREIKCWAISSTTIHDKHHNSWQVHACSIPVPGISYISLFSPDIDRKITLLKNNKDTGLDDISPKLLELAGTTIVAPLTSLFMQSIPECRVYNNWKVPKTNLILWNPYILGPLELHITYRETITLRGSKKNS